MGWADSFKKSAITELSKKIFESSALCAEHLKPYLEEKFKKGSKEYHQKYIEVLFEFLFFFMHLNDRIGFQECGHEKQQKLNEAVGPLVVDPMIKTMFGHWPDHLQEGIRKDFYESLGNAQLEYSQCKSLMVKDDEDISYADKVATGAKSRGTINLLADNLMESLDDYNPVSRAKVMHMVIMNFKIEEFKQLVLKACKEI